MAILVFQHHADETPGRLGATLRDYGHRLRICELFEGEALPPDLDGVDGVVSLGGPMNVDDTHEHAWLDGEIELLRQAHERELPIVGICLGAQLVARALGGAVGPMDQPEVGWQPVQLAFPGTMDPVFGGIPWRTQQFHMHGQQITTLPDGATGLAGSPMCPQQSFKAGLTTYCFQYHFEWNQREIESALQANNALLEKAGVSADQIKQDTAQHYEMHRHLGDRLCHNIANLLMPIDKRYGTTHAAVEPAPIPNWQPAKS